MLKIPVKEVPPNRIKDTGLQLYTGYIINSLRFRAYVPTTIFDPLVAQIRAYNVHDQQDQLPRHREEVVKIETVALKSLPKWSVKYQCLMLIANLMIY